MWHTHGLCVGEWVKGVVCLCVGTASELTVVVLNHWGIICYGLNSHLVDIMVKETISNITCGLMSKLTML